MSEHTDTNKHMREIARALNTFSHDDRKGTINHAAQVYAAFDSAGELESCLRQDNDDSEAQFVLDHQDDIDHVASHFVELVIFLLASEKFAIIQKSPVN